MFHLLPWGHGNSPPFYKRSAAKHTFPTTTLPNSIALRDYPRSSKSVNNPARAGTPLYLSNIVFTARIKHYAFPITNYPYPPSAVSVKMEASAARQPASQQFLSASHSD